MTLHRLIKPTDDLPQLEYANRLYLDFETTSRDKKKDSLNPWFNCWPLGACITADDVPGAWFLPVSDPRFNSYIRRLVSTAKHWVNHNIKYDMHVYCINIGEPEDLPDVICTLTQAKLINSDRLSYSLAVLSDEWLHDDIYQYEYALKQFLESIKSKDYGDVPLSQMTIYGCQDVITNRNLDKYIRARLPEQCHGVRDTEIKLTRRLFDAERIGMRVTPIELMKQEFLALNRLSDIETELKETVGFDVRPHVSIDCHAVLCNFYGLPVMGWTEDYEGNQRNPSFDKAAMLKYATHVDAPKRVVDLLMEYKKLNTLNNFFFRPYQGLNINGVLHPSYNQCVRTGRLSCSAPNMQQLTKSVKGLITPPPGFTFLSCDYSQIEYRLMMHYINDKKAIAAYAADPFTDFHLWVAEMCGISRTPAKAINFMLGFGGGKKKTVEMLSQHRELVQDMGDTQRQMKANTVYSTYHRRLPGIKITSRLAESSCRAKGYVYNLYGRHRHLHFDRAHTAFNTLNQSTAADMMKERCVAVCEFLDAYDGASLVASVHDELLFQIPTDVVSNTSIVSDIVSIMESPNVSLRVPIRTTAGVSDVSWRGAVSDEYVVSRVKTL